MAPGTTPAPKYNKQAMTKISNKNAKYNAVRVYPSIISDSDNKQLSILIWGLSVPISANDLKNIIRRKRLKLICILANTKGIKFYRPVKRQTAKSYRNG